jgi:hypothetical protein
MVGPGNGDESRLPQAREFAEIWEAICRIEKDFDLLKHQVCGTFYWPLLRPRLFDLLCAKRGLFQIANQRLRHAALPRIFREVVPFFRDVHAAPWFIKDRFDTILVPFDRKRINQGNVSDLYMDRVLREPEFGRFLMLDSGKAPGLYREKPGLTVRSRDVLRAQALARSVRRIPQIFRSVKVEYRMLDAALRSALDMACPFSTHYFALRVALFDCGRSAARRIVEKSGAKKLFITGLSFDGIVAGAQDADACVFELQHGVITPYHPCYHYRGRPYVPYAPDYMLAFGSFWSESTDLAGNTKWVAIGSENIERLRATAGQKLSRRVLVLSQGTIGPQLFELALAAAKKTPDWNFVFCPHPYEHADAYRVRLKRYMPINMSISGAAENLYDLLARTEVQIGVYSTSLFEGMTLGARTIVADLPGIEHMALPIARGDVAVARSAQEIVELLALAPRASDASSYYAPPVSSIAQALETHRRTVHDPRGEYSLRSADD